MGDDVHVLEIERVGIRPVVGPVVVKERRGPADDDLVPLVQIMPDGLVTILPGARVAQPTFIYLFGRAIRLDPAGIEKVEVLGTDNVGGDLVVVPRRVVMKGGESFLVRNPADIDAVRHLETGG